MNPKRRIPVKVMLIIDLMLVFIIALMLYGYR